MKEGNCVHHWIINDKDIGRCIKPGCGAVRDFGKELTKWKRGVEEEGRVERGQQSKRGRPRKAKLEELV